jgi:hypothetical protein
VELLNISGTIPQLLRMGQLRQLAKTEKTAFVRTGDNTSASQFLKSDLDAYIAAPRVPAMGAASASRGKKGAK